MRERKQERASIIPFILTDVVREGFLRFVCAQGEVGKGRF
jgi:hypothetical protein